MTAQRRLIGLLCLIGVQYVLALSAALAQPRRSPDIARRNRVIDQTDFIVGDKCPGKLIAVPRAGVAP